MLPRHSPPRRYTTALALHSRSDATGAPVDSRELGSARWAEGRMPRVSDTPRSGATWPAPSPPLPHPPYFFWLDSNILMQKKPVRTVCVALFQHAISSYNTTPSRGFCPRRGSQSWPGRSRMQYWAGYEGFGGGGSWVQQSASTWAISISAPHPPPCGLAPTGLCTVGVILHAPHRKRVCVCICVHVRKCVCVCVWDWAKRRRGGGGVVHLRVW